MINPFTNTWHCWAHKKSSGDSIEFVQSWKHLSFDEAVVYLTPEYDRDRNTAASGNGLLRQKTDVVDDAPVTAKPMREKPASADGVATKMTSATDLPASEQPRPLMRELPPAEPFPVDALGGVLAAAALAIHDRTQANSNQPRQNRELALNAANPSPRIWIIQEQGTGAIARINAGTALSKNATQTAQQINRTRKHAPPIHRKSTG